MPRRVRDLRGSAGPLTCYHWHDMWRRPRLPSLSPSLLRPGVGRRWRRSSRRGARGSRRATRFARRGGRRCERGLRNDLRRLVFDRSLIGDDWRFRRSGNCVLLYHWLILSLGSSRRLRLLRGNVACLPHRDTPSPQTSRRQAALAAHVAKIFVGESAKLAMGRIATKFLAQ
jgi:hypothetical protein